MPTRSLFHPSWVPAAPAVGRASYSPPRAQTWGAREATSRAGPDFGSDLRSLGVSGSIVSWHSNVLGSPALAEYHDFTAALGQPRENGSRSDPVGSTRRMSVRARREDLTLKKTVGLSLFLAHPLQQYPHRPVQLLPSPLLTWHLPRRAWPLRGLPGCVLPASLPPPFVQVRYSPPSSKPKAPTAAQILHQGFA